MNAEAVELAINALGETRRLLEKVVTSSESFDYNEARAGLLQLEKQIRTLSQLQARLQPISTGKILKFPANSLPSTH
ncbi:MAG: hypothetical protein SFY81_04350 [Verrucomicrobiota bacterium]|nr:hypothetical protein [Verrucomicrobiota bacterium]